MQLFRFRPAPAGSGSLRTAAGRLAIAGSLAISGFWAFWGGIEAFHEGWHLPTWYENVGLTLVQYTAPMLLFVLLSLAALHWPRVGLGLYAALAVFCIGFFGRFTQVVVYFLVLPLLGVGALFFAGRPAPTRRNRMLLAGAPLLVMLAAAAYPAYKTFTRVDDGFRGARLLGEGGARLVWAPEGPGWPQKPAPFAHAADACARLSADGTRLEPRAVNRWRLPTAAECVAAGRRHGRPSGGVWAGPGAQPVYRVQPDKETPLWNPRSPVIYWWTATPAGESRLIYVYDGKLWPKRPGGWYGWRCVRRP